MGSKNKLKRFRENETFSNVLQPERDILEKDQFPMKGNWRNKFFKNQNPWNIICFRKNQKRNPETFI